MVADSSTRNRIATLVRTLDPLALTCRLTLLLPALSDWVGGEQWIYRTSLRVLAVAGLLIPGLYPSRLLWSALALLMCARTVDNWWLQDNHLFLLTYWMLAIAGALWLPAPRPALRTSARLLIGWSFAFAALWKIALSPDFMGGDYFRYTFLTDRRFFDTVALVSAVDAAALARNLATVDRLFTSDATVAVLQSSGSILPLVRLATWWTAGIELVLAATFLWPDGRRVSRFRDGTLLVFGATTYLVAPVWTFGWLLLTLGLAQTHPGRPTLRLAYLGTLGLVVLYTLVPLARLARTALGA